MSSPIILLVVWAVFNILIKSSRDKKKAQNAKNKPGERTNVPNNSNMSQRKDRPQKKNFRQTIEEYKEDIGGDRYEGDQFSAHDENRHR